MKFILKFICKMFISNKYLRFSCFYDDDDNDLYVSFRTMYVKTRLVFYYY